MEGANLIYDMILNVTTMSEVGNPYNGWVLEVPADKKESIFQLLDPLFETTEGDTIKLDEKKLSELSELLLVLPRTAIFVSVNGYFDKGKTFFLNKLTQSKLPSGKRSTTRGLSVKLPSHGRYVLLDTAGTNSPIQVELLDRTKEELDLKGELPKTPEFRNMKVSANDIEEFERLKKQFEEETFIAVRKRAMVNKKATEQFLQEVVFQLSDALIVVVNEMTWPDQQTLEAFSMRLQQEVKVNSNRMNRIIVVHNFKESTTLDEVFALRKKYGEDCYYGDLCPQHIILPGMADKVTIYTYENKNRDMTHVFLAQEGSPAGLAINEATCSFVNTLLSSLSIRARDSFLKILCRSAHHVMSPYFLGGITDVSVYYHKNGTLYMKAESSVQPLKLARDEIEYDGMYVTLSASLQFQPRCDVFKTEEAMIVVVDLPGFVWDDKNEGLLNYETQLRCLINKEKNALVIKGVRHLYLRLYDEKTKELTKQCYAYEKSHEGALVERPHGVFERRVPIPVQYVRSSKEWKKTLVNGTLQVYIPRCERDSDSDSE